MITPDPHHSTDAAISCRHLTKSFGSSPPAVDDLTFDAPRGRITGFVGANGAGKTTTLRMLCGLVRPTSGTALVEGRPYRDLNRPRQRVGAVIDGPGAHPRHRARTHLRLLADGAGLPVTRVEETLEQVGLLEHASRRVGTFSLGMRQRLALAGALLGDPPLLLLDEPVNGLDPSGIQWMRRFLRDLADEQRAILISSHLLTELAEIADDVVIIDHGRMAAHDTLDNLAQGRSLEDVYFETVARAAQRRAAQSRTADTGTEVA